MMLIRLRAESSSTTWFGGHVLPRWLDAGIGDVAAPLRHARPSRAFLLTWLALALALALVSASAAITDYLPWDLWLTQRVQAVDLDALTAASSFATRLSGPSTSVAAAIGAVAGFALVRQFRLAAFSLAATWTHLIGGALKLLVDRPRPPGDLIETVRLETEFSYPSGHMEWVVGFEGFLLFAVWRLTSNRGVRALATGAWLLHILLTGFGRVEQGLHWPSDVLGGLLVGAVALLATAWVYLATLEGRPSRIVLRPARHTAPKVQ